MSLSKLLLANLRMKYVLKILFIVCVPYRMKIYTEFNSATWLRLVKFTELNISEFWFLNFNYICYHLEISKGKIISGI